VRPYVGPPHNFSGVARHFNWGKSIVLNALLIHQYEGVYSAPPDPLAGLKWKGREERAGEARKGKEGRDRFTGGGDGGNCFPEMWRNFKR